MRAFIAVELAAESCRALSEATAQLQTESQGLTWVAPERWHITLTFLGEVDDLTLSRLTPRLERVASRTPAFELQLGASGRFGHRVLFVKVRGDRDDLIRLADRTTAAARRERLEVSEATRSPHVTLARSRKGADLRPLAAHLEDFVGPPWAVTEFSLVQSFLGPKPKYETLERFPLAPSAS